MRRAVLAILSTIVGLVLLLTFKTHAVTATGSRPAAIGSTGNHSTGSHSSGSLSSGSSGSSSSSSGSSGSSSSSSSSSSQTVTGDAVHTHYGPVQVQITVSNGKVSTVQATEYPQKNSHDQEINSYAIPELNQEATSAGNAQIDMISGATYTSEGYVQSLQSALDKAGL